MDDTSDTASGSASTVYTAASTLFSSTTNIDWGSKGWNIFFIVSNDGIWLYGLALGLNVGYASQITLIVSDLSVNILEGSYLCGLTI